MYELECVSNLAISLREQGKFAEAEAIDKQTLQLRDTVLGEEDLDTIINMLNLVLLFRLKGKPAEAEALLRQARSRAWQGAP